MSFRASYAWAHCTLCLVTREHARRVKAWVAEEFTKLFWNTLVLCERTAVNYHYQKLPRLWKACGNVRRFAHFLRRYQSYSGIRPCLMAPCHSITTILYTLESLSLPTELSRAVPSIPMTQISNKDYTMHILIFLGSGLSRVYSMSSFQRFVYFPS